MNKRITSLASLAITAALTSAITLTSAHAAYYTVELMDESPSPVAKHSYAQQANTQGESVLSGTNLYNVPVQFDLLSPADYISILQFSLLSASRYQELSAIDDEAWLDLIAGTPQANELSWTVLWLSSKSSTHLYQKVTGTLAMYNQSGNTEILKVFDQTFDDGQFTRSTLDILKGITDNSFMFGSASAPYLPLDPWFIEPVEPEDPDIELTYRYRDFSKRAFYSIDFSDALPIIPSSESIDGITAYGGESGILGAALSVDEPSHYAVGFMSTAINETILADKIIGICDTPIVVDDEGNIVLDDEGNSVLKYNTPVEICYQLFRDAGGMYDIRGFLSTVTTDGAETVELPLLVTPHVDDPRSFAAYAQAVNKYGVAVGYSHGWGRENVTEPVVGEVINNYAVVYKKGDEGEWVTTSIADNHSTDFDSRAYDINDNGIAVGHVTRAVNGKIATKFYYVDTNNVEEMESVFPTDFFTTSSSTARAINNDGMIVGEGQVETHTERQSNPRRTAAFIYNINTEIFTNLNTLILSKITDDETCALVYNIIEARDINDDGTISASAVTKVPRLDAKGEPLLDSDGVVRTEDAVVAVRLIETDEQPTLCKPVDIKTKRQGASFSIGSLLFIFALLGMRRRQKGLSKH